MEELRVKLNDIVRTIDDLYLNTSILECPLDRDLKDMGIDSLGKINLFYGIIDHYGIERDESEAVSWKTLGDVLNYIENL